MESVVNYFQARLKTLDCLPVPAVFRVPQELLPRSRAAGCLVNDVAWCGRCKELLTGAALCNTFSRSQVSSRTNDRDAHFILDVPFISFVVVILYLSLDLFLSGVKPCSYHGCTGCSPTGPTASSASRATFKHISAPSRACLRACHGGANCSKKMKKLTAKAKFSSSFQRMNIYELYEHECTHFIIVHNIIIIFHHVSSYFSIHSLATSSY